jgi:tRNA-binding EMAP/Myf-like protein
MSDIEHSGDLAALSLSNYSSIKAGMEIIAGDATILGRIVSVNYHLQSDSFRILFVDSIHPMLNFCSSIYEMSAVSIVSIGENLIVIAGDVIPEIVEVKLGIFRSVGLVSSLTTKIESKKPSYKRIESKKSSYYKSGIAKRVSIDFDDSIERIDWANDGREYGMDKIDRDEDFWGDNLDWNDGDRWNDDDLPGAGVLRPKKPNPNLPPSMILVDDDDYRF